GPQKYLTRLEGQESRGEIGNAKPSAPSMAVAVDAPCQIRDRLATEVRQALTHYHNTFSQLLQSRSIEKASRECEAVYEAAVNARGALRKHEAEHGCAR